MKGSFLLLTSRLFSGLGKYKFVSLMLELGFRHVSSLVSCFAISLHVIYSLLTSSLPHVIVEGEALRESALRFSLIKGETTQSDSL